MAKKIGVKAKAELSEWARGFALLSDPTLLGDNDIVNLVNLKFLSKHYRHSPEEIIKMKSNGTSFAKINHNVKKSKASKKSGKNAKSSKGKSKSTKKRK